MPSVTWQNSYVGGCCNRRERGGLLSFPIAKSHRVNIGFGCLQFGFGSMWCNCKCGGVDAREALGSKKIYTNIGKVITQTTDLLLSLTTTNLVKYVCK